MIDPFNTYASTPPTTHTALLAELEGYEHLVFEPMTQADLDSLYALYSDWQQRLGDSPEAIAICDALDSFIEANIDEGQESHVEQAYLDLVAAVNAVRFFSRC
jgi:hypothetical protein